MDSNKIADVLEEAARLYKDEKVEWCNGSWVEVEDGPIGEEADGSPIYQPDPGGPDGLDAPGLKVSACAEGALLRAAGFSWNVIDAFSGYAEQSGEREWLEQFDKEAADLFYASRDSLSGYLLTHREEGYVSTTALRWEDSGRMAASVEIPSWNDTMEGQIVDKHFFRVGQPRLTPSEMAKTVVIDTMEATAKDLRNQGQV